MLVILINWLYIGITTFLTGYAVLGLFARLFEYRIRHSISYVFAGLATVTVYAQIFSLFGGVNRLANVFLVVFCVLIYACNHKDINFLVKNTITECRIHKWRIPAFLFLILLMAYGTSRGYMHFDTGLYHAQSIRWIEEYGVVPGLANLQARFGYNSAAFSLTALYSMKWLVGQSLHATAGFFALLSARIAFDLYKVFTEKRICLSDFARLGLIFYLSVIFSEMMSPASDYYAQLLLFNILILWLDEDDYQKKMQIQNPTPYGLLCILLVYAMTIKFSVAPLLLLVIKPMIMLLKNKDGKQIAGCLLGGFITALPFFIRNVLISGWLIYPSAIIDLFTVDWKIPKGQVQYDAMEIGVYGKGIRDVTQKDMPITQWCPAWFDNLKGLEKLFVLATIIMVVSYLLYLAYIVIKRKNVDCHFTLVLSVFVVGTGFWFFTAPLVRYGYAYVVVVPAITVGYYFIQFWESRKKKKNADGLWKAACVVIALFLLTRVKGVCSDILRTYNEPFYIMQTDYADGEATTQEVDGILFYVPTQGGQIGYDKFPSSIFPQPIELRGDSIEDGFRQVDEWK